jgi:hypothetical protein
MKTCGDWRYNSTHSKLRHYSLSYRVRDEVNSRIKQKHTPLKLKPAQTFFSLTNIYKDDTQIRKYVILVCRLINIMWVLFILRAFIKLYFRMFAQHEEARHLFEQPRALFVDCSCCYHHFR